MVYVQYYKGKEEKRKRGKIQNIKIIFLSQNKLVIKKPTSTGSLPKKPAIFMTFKKRLVFNISTYSSYIHICALSS